MLVNEWQTGQRLNQAVQQQRLADFALVLAMYSPDVRDFAQFHTPESMETPVTLDLYQQLGVTSQRDYGWIPGDELRLNSQTQALQLGGAASCHLQQLLQPDPWVMQHDAKKLSDEVRRNLPLHCLRLLQQVEAPAKTEADATGLYEILNELHQPELAA
ncbi:MULTISPECIES: VC2046/SO_2500 family protein [Rheinheimera]|uniref:VC2046/SO_2500 family protein n=1 Tax=Rheinheimera marina TaxID=1774958 RepID=A0ABV9JQZ1_9GAMM